MSRAVPTARTRSRFAGTNPGYLEDKIRDLIDDIWYPPEDWPYVSGLGMKVCTGTTWALGYVTERGRPRLDAPRLFERSRSRRHREGRDHGDGPQSRRNAGRGRHRMAPSGVAAHGRLHARPENLCGPYGLERRLRALVRGALFLLCVVQHVRRDSDAVGAHRRSFRELRRRSQAQDVEQAGLGFFRGHQDRHRDQSSTTSRSHRASASTLPEP